MLTRSRPAPNFGSFSPPRTRTMPAKAVLSTSTSLSGTRSTHSPSTATAAP